MSQVPIPSSIKDPFFRYKRDTVNIEITNLTKGPTIITNMDLICKQLNVDINHVKTFYAKSLGNSVSYKNNKFVIKAIQNYYTVEDVLEKYIAKYVLCKKCKLPELDKNSICNACGYKSI